MTSTDPTLVLFNADIRTMDGDMPHASTLLVEGGRIVAIGDSGQVRRCVGSRYEAMDCHGDVLLPAFVDAHLHLLAYAAALISVDCSPAAAPDIPSLLAAIERSARCTPPGAWIRAVGYRETELRERRHPTRWELDRAAPMNPVRLIHGSGHGSVLNSRALQAIGIDTGSEEPTGGYIGRHLEDGEPDGLLLEMNDLIAARVPQTPWADLRAAVQQADRRLLTAGVTSVQDLGARNDRSTLTLFERLRADGALTVAVACALGYEAFAGGEVPGWHGTVKVVITELGNAIDPPLTVLAERLARIDAAGATAAVHAVSQAAIERAVDAFERVLGPRPMAQRRHRLEHVAICPPVLARRIARLGLIAVCNPGFLHAGGERYLREVAPDDVPYLHNGAVLAGAGATVAAGSDAPAGEPFPLRGVAAMAMRRSAAGSRLPGATASLHAALAAHTLDAAAVVGDNERGQLRSGFAADLVRLPAGSLASPDELPAAPVATMRAGRWIGDTV